MKTPKAIMRRIFAARTGGAAMKVLITAGARGIGRAMGEAFAA